MSDSSVIDWTGGLFAEKGRAVASGGFQPVKVGGPTVVEGDARPSQPASLTGAVLGAKRAAFVVSTGTGGSGPVVEQNAASVLAFVDPRKAAELAGETPRPAPARRRIRTGIRLDPERRRRLTLVAGFTGRTAQAVIIAALLDYLNDMVPCAAAALERGTDRGRSARASSPGRVSQRSLRLHPHLYWRLAMAARKTRVSMQSIIIGALDSHLDTVAPAISAEVFSCLMGWTDVAGVSAPRSKPRPAHWRARSGRPLGRRRLRNGGVPRLPAF